MRSRQVVAVEALCRWRHPERGMVPATEFIALAEESGFIRQLGLWTLAEALRQRAHLWPEEGRRGDVAVNMSLRNLRSAELPAVIDNLLRTWNVPPSALRIEVTETSAMADVERTLATLTQLHEMGVAISIDDFGTGYSSLAYLHRMPVDPLFHPRPRGEREQPGHRGIHDRPRAQPRAQGGRRGRRDRGGVQTARRARLRSRAGELLRCAAPAGGARPGAPRLSLEPRLARGPLGLRAGRVELKRERSPSPFLRVRSRGSRTRLTARPRIGRKSTSAGYAVLKSASTITLLALISSAMRRSRHGGKITAASRMAIK